MCALNHAVASDSQSIPPRCSHAICEFYSASRSNSPNQRIKIIGSVTLCVCRPLSSRTVSRTAPCKFSSPLLPVVRPRYMRTQSTVRPRSNSSPGLAKSLTLKPKTCSCVDLFQMNRPELVAKIFPLFLARLFRPAVHMRTKNCFVRNTHLAETSCTCCSCL